MCKFQIRKKDDGLYLVFTEKFEKYAASRIMHCGPLGEYTLHNLLSAGAIRADALLEALQEAEEITVSPAFMSNILKQI